MGCRSNIVKMTPVDMEVFSEKLTWLNILYNKMHCHKKNYFKLRKVKSKKKPLTKIILLTSPLCYAYYPS